MTVSRPRTLVGTAVLLFIITTACSGGGGGRKGNRAPSLQPPTGPGAVAGAGATWTTTIGTGDPLDFSVAATDRNKKDDLVLDAAVTGGTLTAAQAGFTSSFPAQATGNTLVMLTSTGTAATGGTIEITFDVTDGKKADSLVLTITIVAPNVPPGIGQPTGPGTVAGADPSWNTTVAVGQPLTFSVTATDADPADILTLTSTVTGGTLNPTQAGFGLFPNSVTGTSPVFLLFTGTAGNAGDIEITFDVDDGQGGMDQIAFLITITSNFAPVIAQPTGSSGSDPTYTRTIEIGTPLDFTVDVTDGDPTDTVVFTASLQGGTLSAAQAGFNETFPSMTSGPSPRQLAFTGTAATVGTIGIVFTADDGRGGADMVSLMITISTRPVLGAPSGPGTVTSSGSTYFTTVLVGATLDFDVTATDADPGDTITVQATDGAGSITPAQAGFNEVFPVNQAGASPQVLAFTGTAAASGTAIIDFLVTDAAGLADTIRFEITVVANAVPVIGSPTGPGLLSGSDPSYLAGVVLGDSIALDITATDADATDTLTFTATVTGGTLTAAQAGFNETFPLQGIGISPRVLSLTGASATTGTIEVTFDVDDANGGTDVVTLLITIHAAPAIGAPTGPGTVGGSDPNYTTSITVSDPLDFTVDATDDGVAGTIDFTATVTGGTLTAAQAGFNEVFPVLVSGASPQQIALTGTAAMAGTIELTLDADDGGGGTDRITHLITIGGDVTPPADIGDLGAFYTGALDTIELRWTAPGDDGMAGTATAYILKFSKSPITNDAEFNAATSYPQAWTPIAAGGTEMKVIDLTQVATSWNDGVGYFAIKAEDEVPNTSGLLNPLTVDLDPVTTLPGTSHDFGDVDFHNAVSRDFGVSNGAGALVDLTLNTVSISGDPDLSIAAGGGAGIDVTPGSTHTITVEYLPAAVGAHGATLSIAHTDPGLPTPHDVTLTGRGVNAAPTIPDGTFSQNPAPDPALVTITADVLDANSDFSLPYDDIASVTMDKTSVGGPAADPMAFVSDDGGKTATYDTTVDTTGLGNGVFDLPVTATDMAGAQAVRTFTLVVSNGSVLNVPSLTYPTIQSALDAAAPAGDVVLIADGTYTGVGNKNLLINGKAVIVMSENGAASTIIDCEASGRGFTMIDSGETNATHIIGLTIFDAAAGGIHCQTTGIVTASPTITGCVFDSNTNGNDGGGVRLDGTNANPLFRRCTFIGNDAGAFRGGAIYAENGASIDADECTFDGNSGQNGGAVHQNGGTLTLTNSTLVGNSSAAPGGNQGAVLVNLGGAHVIDACVFDGNTGGGGLYASGDLTLTGSTFRNNSSNSGGAMRANGTFTIDITDCVFEGNMAADGGAIFTAAAAPVLNITGCTFRSNMATGSNPSGRGGALYLAWPVGQVTVDGTVFEANTAGFRGGAFFIGTQEQMDITNCLFFGNSAVDEGGGIYVSETSAAGSLDLRSTTLAGNSADTGGGMSVFLARMLVRDTILWENTATTTGAQLFVRNDASVTMNVQFCDIDVAGLDDAGLRINSPSGFIPGMVGNISLDPLFFDSLADDYHLSQMAAGQGSDSPCVDSGSDTAAALGLDALTTRTDDVPDAGTVDMGYHYTP